ncbi:parallel beta-helix repeat (two copies) [Mucilaginibacter pineti]|uniref:Parallel beta-helix repeat (Two copies) n=1 Tax=Mucilaginibacter pineti TaxID=1391627 RepID=A0A1G7GAP4_9SPHI|nr:right-handed parallel beta-helix repeat-containing protein [Mucilaginibacter pineti]SDE85218.1 parallel beta-helix repeat (two copies) [Mucilaginibacter pineti]
MRKLFSLYLCLLSLMASATEYHVAKKGRHTFRTIGEAAAVAKPGDVIIVHNGIYRELVAPAISGVTYRAAKGEKPEIRGSEVVSAWTPERPGIWKLVLPNSYFGNYNPYTDLIFGDWFFPQKLKLHTGEVYLNGKALEEGPGWTTEQKDGQTIIYAHFNHLNAKDVVEINVRPSCFYPAKTGVNNITVSGFVLKQAATQWAAPTAEQVGIIGTNWSSGWTIENNTISDSKCVGITLGKDRASGQNPWSAEMSKEGSDIYNDMIKLVAARDWNKQNIGSHIVRNNTIYNCGVAGICGSLGAINSQILHNTIHDIYTRRNFYGAEMAGIKIHGAIDVIIKGNKVSNAFIGLWLDWMAQGTVISGNTFSGNDYADFFPEVNHGPYLFKDNVMLSPVAFRDWSEGGTLTHNLFGGKLSRAPQDRQTPYFKPHSTKIIGVKKILGGNNTFTNNYFLSDGPELKIPLMHPWDKPDSLQSYGLSLYDSAAQPVIRRNNHIITKKNIAHIIKQHFLFTP